MYAVDPSLYPQIKGHADTELLFFLALTFGLEDDPIAAVAQAVGLVEAVADQHGVPHPFQGTIATSDGETIWAFRYSSERKSRTLYYTTDVPTLRTLYPTRELFREVSEDARLIVSEPLGDVAGVWNEVPEVDLWGRRSRSGGDVTVPARRSGGIGRGLALVQRAATWSAGAGAQVVDVRGEACVVLRAVERPFASQPAAGSPRRRRCRDGDGDPGPHEAHGALRPAKARNVINGCLSATGKGLTLASHARALITHPDEGRRRSSASSLSGDARTSVTHVASRLMANVHQPAGANRA